MNKAEYKAELIKAYMNMGLTEEEARHIVNAMETELDEDGNKEDVVRCAMAIKEYCDSQPTCQKCHFKEENGTEHMCALHKCPNEWEVEKESRGE